MRTRACIVLTLPWRDPLAAFAPFCDEPYAILLGPGGSGQGLGRWSILCARPENVFEASYANALDALPALPVSAPDAPLPFCGGYAGLASYELGASLDRAPRLEGSGWPDIAIGYYPTAALFDHQKRMLHVVGPDAQKARRFANLLGDQSLSPLPSADKGQVHYQSTRQTCLEHIRKVIRLIHAGDIFQANISQGFDITLDAEQDAFSYFRHLCAQSPSPYSAYFRRQQGQTLISNSPEQFFSLNTKGVMQTSPIKGTRPRSADEIKDRTLAHELLNCAKDRAENLMIVDLMRNDLSRVCTPGTVKVKENCALQSFVNVHHLVSTVEGKLQEGKTAKDILAACFPAGSITGAPKIRAMEIIAQIESKARGPYCGSLGYISQCGAAEFNVLIRTAEHQSRQGTNQLYFRTGGGIVADSDPAAEYQEMRDKARALCQAAGAQI